MSDKSALNPKEQAKLRDNLIASIKLDQHERYLALLKHAQRIRINNRLPDTLSDVIKKAEFELQSFRTLATGSNPSRRRPRKHINPNNRCLVFIDECGSSSLTSPDTFSAFVIAAVIVSVSDYTFLNKKFKKWKHDKLGSAKIVIHEPEIRRGSGPFLFKGDVARKSQVEQSLSGLISKLPFSAVACIINRPEYIKQFGPGSMDESLPVHPYLMALDFLLERMVMILETKYDCANAQIIAESRGLHEDALLQYEYVRLQLDGTSYVSPNWFRQQLSPSITFLTKKDNDSGLQLADLLARPCGEKVLNPSSTPMRWTEFREKLCDSKETEHSILGFKIVPCDDSYNDIWKS